MRISDKSGSEQHSRPFTPFLELIRRSGPSGLILWFFPVFRVIISRRRAFDEFDTLDRSALLQIAFVCICAVHVMSVYFSPRRKLFNLVLSPPLNYILAYIVICALSSLWSIYPLYTAYRAFECLVFLLLISIAIANLWQSPEDIVEWIVCWTFLDLCCYIIMRRATIMSAGIHLYTLGGIGMLTVGPVLFLALFISKRKLLKVLFLLACAISTSTKIYIGFIIGLFCACVSGRKKERYLIPYILGIGVSLILLAGTTGVIHVFFVGKSDETIETGTGRIPLWYGIIEMGMESPLLGKGFSIGELAVVAEGVSNIRMAHNSFLAAFIGTGLLGFVPILLFFCSLAKLSLRQQVRPEWKAGLVGSVVMATFISMFAPGIGGSFYGAWISVILLAGLVASLANPK